MLEQEGSDNANGAVPSGTALARAMHRVLERAIPRVEDPPLAWRGIDDPGLSPLRVVRYGDCSWREVVGAHQLGERPGYPLVVAERLREHGIGMRFTNHHVTPAEALPVDGPGVRKHLRSGERPDLVWIQVGCAYAIRSMLPVETYSNRVRLRINGRLGSAGGTVHSAITAPALRRFGRYAYEFPGWPAVQARIEEFIRLIRRSFPGASVALLFPWGASSDGWMNPNRLEAVGSVLGDVCENCDVLAVDARAQLRDAELRGVAVRASNGYDLTRAGHEVVTDAILEQSRLLAT